jgi:tetratricopeptide (TPR) repeat protein
MSKQAEIANDRAIEYWEQNRFDDAIAQWEAIVRRDPNLAEIHYNLGNAYMYQGKVESAIEALKRAVSIDPNLPEAYNKLGIICYKQGDSELAFACWKQALRINPNFEEARRNVGLIQNLPQLDLDDEIPAYQHVTEDDAKDDESASIEGDNDPPRWRNRISRGWGAFRKK